MAVFSRTLDQEWLAFTEFHASLGDAGPHAKEFKVFWEHVKAKVRWLGICNAV